MTFASPFVYLRINGKFGSAVSPVERWTVGLKFPTPATGISSGLLEDFMEACLNPILTFHQGQVNSGTATYLLELTSAVVGTDGKYVGGGAQITTRTPWASPQPGAGTPRHPWATSCVISLRTPLARGRASNGRMYWPATAIGVDTETGVYTSANTDGIAGQAAAMLNAINAASEAVLPSTSGIWVMSNVGSGLSAPVTSIRVGGKPDHMETRERQIVEAYSTAPITAVAAGVAGLRDRPVDQPPVFSV